MRAERAEALRQVRRGGQRDVLLLQAFGKLAQLQAGDRAEIRRGERPEGRHAVDAAEKFRRERLAQDGLRAHILAVRRKAEAGFAGLRAGQVRGHDDDGVFEADRAAEAVGQDAVAEQLQQDACHVAVGLFQLIEEQDAVGAAADLLRERAARVVADVARRRAEQARDARRFHILRHIHPDERVRAAVDDLRELFT